jgi:hypothetical protein
MVLTARPDMLSRFPALMSLNARDLIIVMFCPYCGLESPVATNHASTGECIAALRLELIRLERLLDRRHGDAVRSGVSDPCNATASQRFEADQRAPSLSSDT